MMHGTGRYPRKPETWYTPEPVLDYIDTKSVYGNPPFGGSMGIGDRIRDQYVIELPLTFMRRWKRPSIWRRIWRTISDHVTLAHLVMVAFSTFMLWYILDAARAGRLPAGW